MTNFKLYFGSDDIRRIRVDEASWSAFTAKLKELCPEYAPESWFIKYKDEEGDLITVMSSREWDTMLQTEKNDFMPIKLYITETPAGMAPTVNVIAKPANTVAEEDAPEEQTPLLEEAPPAEVHHDEEEEEAAAEEQPVPEEDVSGEKEQPNEDLLGFEVVQPEESDERPLVTNDNFEGFLDMDVCVFFDRLRRQACALLDPAENEALRKGKEFLQNLIPDDNPTWFKSEKVVDSLKQAYKNIKELPELQEFVALLSSLGGNDAPQKKKRPSYETELATLQSMGFTDTETNEALLVKYRGNLPRVVDILLAELH